MVFMGMSLNQSVDIQAEFGTMVDAYLGKYFHQPPVRSAPKTFNRYTHGRVNVRKGPGTEFKVVRHLEPGELIRVSKSTGQWMKVYKDGKINGFVYGSLLSPVPFSHSERQRLLYTAAWGDFRKSKKFKLVKPREAVFAIWEPILSHAVTTQYSKAGKPATSPEAFLHQTFGPKKLPVAFDELWVWENDAPGNPKGRARQQGRGDTYRMYWLNGKVQAHIIGKFYERNPETGKKLSPPIHKIWKISDRERILKRLKR